MWHDPIVDEIHQIREEHAQKFNFDLKSIYGDLKEREMKSGIQTVSLPIKRLQIEGTDS